MPVDRSRLRILHVPNDLGGHPRALAQAQRALGHDAVCVSLAHSALGFNGDELHDAPPASKGRLLKREKARLALLWRSFAWADVIHCHFGQSLLSVRALPIHDRSRHGVIEQLTVVHARLLWLKDLAWWRMAGKRVAMTFYGDDIRRLDLSESRNPNSHMSLLPMRHEFLRRDSWKRKLAERLERHGVLMFATNPDLLLGLPPSARFLSYGHVDTRAHPVLPPLLEGHLRFIHMPTDRDVKGTSQFVAAVAQLQSEGEACSLTLVEGRSNRQALAELDRHDVLLDQLRAGWYGGVAVEAMAKGKPVVAWINPADKAFVPDAFAREIPLVDTSLDTVPDALRRLIRMPRQDLVDIGLRSRLFVETWHDPKQIASTVLSSYFD